MPKVKVDTKAADNRLKRKGASAGRKQSKKAAKDPNKSKRPPSAFFVFMSEFREQFKKEHPANKSVAVLLKRNVMKLRAWCSIYLPTLVLQEQLDFPVLYDSAKEGWVSTTFTKDPPAETKNVTVERPLFSDISKKLRSMAASKKRRVNKKGLFF